jgi:hypothetical protein
MIHVHEITKDVTLKSWASGFGRKQMTSILTAEDVVRRIAAECAYVDERGGVGIRLEPAAAIVQQLPSPAHPLYLMRFRVSEIRRTIF